MTWQLSPWDSHLAALDGEGNADSAWAAGYEYGAAAAFGLMGMAEAIRAFTWRPFWVCMRCETENYEMRSCWCVKCAPRRHAREIREGFPDTWERGQWREDES